MSQQALQGFSFLTASLILSSLNDVIMKSMGSHLPGAQMSFLRFSSAALMVALWAVYQGKKFSAPQYSYIHILRGFFLFVGMSLWAHALHEVSLAQAVLINFTIPFFQLILGHFVLKEHISRGHIAATICGFCGVVLSCTDVTLNLYYVPGLLLASALFASCDLLNKISTQNDDDGLSTLFYTAFYTALMGFAPAAFVWQSPVLKDFLGLLILGISSNVLFYFLLQGLKRLTLVQTAPFRYMEIVVSSGLAYVFFGETPAMEVALGALLIIPSALWVVLQQHNSFQEETAAA